MNNPTTAMSIVGGRTSPRPLRLIDSLYVLAPLAGFALMLLAFYPGTMDNDSEWQLDQAVKGVYDNCHPAMMAFVWSWFLPLTGRSSAGIFLFHIVMYWTALAIIFRFSFGQRVAGPILLLLLGLAPPASVMLGSIWKDMSLATSYLICFALLFLAERTRRRWAFALAFPFAFYCVGVRHNGIFLLAPLFLWMGSLFPKLFLAPGRSFGWKTRTSLAAVLTLVFYFGASRTNRWLAPQASFITGCVQIPFAFDLAGISIYSNRVYLPEYISPPDNPFPFHDLERNYSPSGHWFLFWGDKTRKFPFAFTAEHGKQLWDTWRLAVRSEPFAYLLHRTQVFFYLLSLNRTGSWYIYIPPKPDNPLAKNELTAAIYAATESLRETLLFRAWPYAVATALLFIAGLVASPERRRPMLALAGGGLLYTAAWLFVAPGSDLRYSFPLLPIPSILAVLLLGPELRSAPSRGKKLG